MNEIVFYALPALAMAILAELALSRRNGRGTYRLNDAIANMSQGLNSQGVAVLTPLFQIGIYTWVHGHVSLFDDAPL